MLIDDKPSGKFESCIFLILKDPLPTKPAHAYNMGPAEEYKFTQLRSIQNEHSLLYYPGANK